MSENVGTATVIVDKTANAAPLGFTGLGLAAVLLSLSYIGIYPVESMIVSMVSAGLQKENIKIDVSRKHLAPSGWTDVPLETKLVFVGIGIPKTTITA